MKIKKLGSGSFVEVKEASLKGAKALHVSKNLLHVRL